MSRQKAKEKRDEIAQIYGESEWDIELHRILFGELRCLKCGSENFKEILDAYDGVTYCCNDCPDNDELN